MARKHSNPLDKKPNLSRTSVESILTKFREEVEKNPSSRRWTCDSQPGSLPHHQRQLGDRWTQIAGEKVVCVEGKWVLQKAKAPEGAILCMEEVAMFIIEKLEAGKSKDEIHGLVKSTPGLLEKDIRFVFKLIKSELGLKSSPRPPSTGGDHQDKCPFSRYNEEQRYLFCEDSRGLRLRDYYRQQISRGHKNPRNIGDIEVRRASKSLEVAFPGKAQHLGCSCSPDSDADWFIMTEDEHYKWAANPTLDIVVIRDKEYIERSGEPFSAQQFRDDLGSLPRDSTVTIQDWSKDAVVYKRDPRKGKRRKIMQMAATRVLVSEALEDWKSSDLVDHRQPKNMLSIQELRPRSPPCGFAKYYTFLDRAIAHSNITSKAAIDPSNTTIGKDTLRLANDISACRRLTLFGERGASSGCHIDLMGVSTGVTIEPSMHSICSGSTGFAASLQSSHSNPLKYWLVVSLRGCTTSQVAQERQRFVDLGAEYIPELPARFVVISLLEGDTLIIPPGCMHAPLTVTDCLIRGFMGVHPQHVERSIEIWHWLDNNRDCSNEEPHRETRRILEFYVRAVSSDPLQYGITDLHGFLEKCRSIGAAALSCHESCTPSKKRKGAPPPCSCEAVGVPCAENCPSEEAHSRRNTFGRWPSDLRHLEGVRQ